MATIPLRASTSLAKTDVQAVRRNSAGETGCKSGRVPMMQGATGSVTLDLPAARLRFAGGATHAPGIDPNRLARAVESSMPVSTNAVVEVELKKREPWLRGLADVLGVEVAVLREAARLSTTPNTTRAQVVPALLADQAVPYERSRDFGSLETKHNTSVGLAGRRVVLSVARKVLYRGGPLSAPTTVGIHAPLVQIDPAVYDAVVRREPGILRALEKLASYASHDVLHMLLDDHWSTRSGGEKEWLLTIDTPFKGFTPNVYEYALFSLMRAAFERACRLYPMLESVLARDAEAFVVAVEAYRSSALSAETDEDPVARAADVNRQCDYLLGLGLSKCLAFLINPGPPPDAEESSTWQPRSEGERRLRAIFERYPKLWANTTLQRDIHDPKLSFRRGGARQGKVDIARVGRMLLGLSLHRDVQPDLGLAERLAGSPRAAREEVLRAWAEAGDASAMYALGKLGIARDGKSWSELAIDAGHPAACAEAAYKLQSHADAARRFELLSHATHVEDIYQLALCYLEGNGTSVDVGQAIATLKKALCFEGTNYPAAEFALWRCYNQPGPHHDAGLAEKHLQRAADLGWGPAKKMVRERELRAAASSGGVDDTIALAKALNNHESLPLLERAAASGSALGMFELACFYAREYYDYERAAHWFGLAHAAGYPDADRQQYEHLLESGKPHAVDVAATLLAAARSANRPWTATVKRAPSTAVDWSQPLESILQAVLALRLSERAEPLRRLHAMGCHEASGRLATMHVLGCGVARDPELALRYGEAAAGDGKAESAYNLYAIAEELHGPARQGSVAYLWLEEAARRGDETAQVRLRQLGWYAEALASDQQPV